MRHAVAVVCLLALVLVVCCGAAMGDAASLAPNATKECYYNVQLEWSARVGSSIVATPRILDLVHDGRREIMVPTYSHFLEVLSGATGEDVHGFPFVHPKFKSHASPVAVDLDADGKTDWLIAMYNGELVVFGEDGVPRGLLKVPPLAVKKQWWKQADNKEARMALRVKQADNDASMLHEIARARKIDDLTIRVPPSYRAQGRMGNSSYRGRTHPSAAKPAVLDAGLEEQGETIADGVGQVPVANRRRTGAVLASPVKLDDGAAEAHVWTAIIEVEEEDADGAFSTVASADATESDDTFTFERDDAIGPHSRLSPEAKASMGLLFESERYRTPSGGADDEDDTQDTVTSRLLRGELKTTVLDDEVAVDAHILSTPVIANTRGQGFEAIIHVSYYFDDETVRGAPLPDGVAADDVAATALVSVNLVTGALSWSRLLHLTRKDDAVAAFALSTPLVINADEEAGMDIYVTSTTGSVHGVDHKGQPLSGWPVWLGPITASPTAEDVTGDGRLDICVADIEGTVACFAPHGQKLWQQSVVGGVSDSLSFGDVNGDGVVDVLLGTTAGYLYALHGATGSPLKGFPFITGGPILAPPLPIGLRPAVALGSLQLVVPSHDGQLYIVDGLSGCAEVIDLDEKSSTMVLADDITGNGYMDLLVTTVNGGVYVFETQAAYDPLKVWPSKMKGINGATASENFLGVSFDPEFRTVRDVQGDLFSIRFTIHDNRRTRPKSPRYDISIYSGSRVRLYRGTFTKATSHVVKVRAPLERTTAAIVINLVLPNGQVFTDSIAMSFNLHFLETIKYTVLVPFAAVTLALMFVHRRHEVEIPEQHELLY